jgi:hypothetical protein
MFMDASRWCVQARQNPYVIGRCHSWARYINVVQLCVGTLDLNLNLSLILVVSTFSIV